jgi:hypothetical protein
MDADLSRRTGGWRDVRAVLRHVLDSDGWYAGWEGGCAKDPGLALFERVPLTREEHEALSFEPCPDDTLFGDTLFNEGA